MRPAKRSLALSLDEERRYLKLQTELKRIAASLETNFDTSLYRVPADSIPFEKISCDIQWVILQYAWSAEDHLNLIRVSKLFREILSKPGFYTGFLEPRYFPSPQVMTIWRGRYAKLPAQLFDETFTRNKPRSKLKLEFLSTIGNDCYSLLKLWNFLETDHIIEGDHHQVSYGRKLLNLIDQYPQLELSKYLNWFALATSASFWSFGLENPSFSETCPLELLDRATSTFKAYIQDIYDPDSDYDDKVIYPKLTVKWLILNWQEVKEYTGNRELFLKGQELTLEESDQLLTLIDGCNYSAEVFLIKIRRISVKSLSTYWINRLLTLLEAEHALPLYRVSQILFGLRSHPQFNDRVNSILIRQYPLEIINKDLNLPREEQMTFIEEFRQKVALFEEDSFRDPPYSATRLNEVLADISAYSYQESEVINLFFDFALGRKYWDSVNFCISSFSWILAKNIPEHNFKRIDIFSRASKSVPSFLVDSKDLELTEQYLIKDQNRNYHLTRFYREHILKFISRFGDCVGNPESYPRWHLFINIRPNLGPFEIEYLRGKLEACQHCQKEIPELLKLIKTQR